MNDARDLGSHIEEIRHDIAARLERIATGLEASESRFRDMILRTTDGIVIVDATGCVQYANPAAETIFGCPASEFVGGPFGLPVTGRRSVEMGVLGRDGEHRVVDVRVSETTWEGQDVSLVSVRDVTRRKEDEELLRRDAMHDPVTGLASPRLLEQHLRRVVDRTRRDDDYRFALLLVLVLAPLRSAAGDEELYREVAGRLESARRPGDVVARASDAEFGLILDDLHHDDEIDRAVARVSETLARPLTVRGRTVALRMRIGVVTAGRGCPPPSEILERARDEARPPDDA